MNGDIQDLKSDVATISSQITSINTKDSVQDLNIQKCLQTNDSQGTLISNLQTQINQIIGGEEA